MAPWWIKLYSKLPLSLLYIFAYKLYILAYYVIGYRKKVVKENLERCFPNKSPKEIKQITKKFYLHFMQLIVEVVKSFSMTKEDFKKHVKFTNPEILEDYIKNGQSAIVLTSHQANWEWILLGGGANLSFPIDAVYKRLSNKTAEEAMLHLRSRFGGKPIEMNNTIMEMMKRKKVPRGFGLVADQSPGKDEIEHWSTFLGVKTPMYNGPVYLAKMSKYPVVFLAMRRVKRGYYECTIEKIAEPPYEKDSNWIIDVYAQKVERLIQEAPEDWLWTHRRWKHA